MPTLPTPEQDPLLNVPASEIEEAFSNDAEEVTADEKSSERIFERNLAAATAHARRLVDSLQAEKIGESLKSTPAAPLPSGPKLKELIEEDSRRERTFLDGAAEGFKKFRLERRGVKDPAAFLVFQKYLEAHMEESEFEHTTVPTVEVEQKKEELKAKGCRVTSTYPAYGKADMSELSFMYKKPFRITKENTKPVADLLGGPLDPLEIVALLQELGFSVDGHTYNYNADVLRDFIAKPSMKETLEKLLKLGLKTNEISFSRKDAKSGYPSLGTVEEIEKISENTELLALLTDEVLGNARSLIEATKVEVPLRADRIKELVTVAGDGDARKALLALVGIRYTNLAHSPQALLFVIRAKERQLLSTVVRVSDIVDFSSISSSDPIFAFLSHTASALDVEKSLDALSVECAEGEFKPATADEPFRAFVQSMSALSGGLNAQDLVALRKLESIQSEALALAGLFKEAGVSLKYGFDKSAEAIEEIVADKALLARLLEPELRDFIRGFEKATGQSFSFFDFTKTRGTVPILELYDNTETRTALSSPATVSVIKALGSFNTNRVDMYQRLGAAPGMLLLIEELKAKFGYEPSPRGWHDAIPEQFLLDLANDVSAHKHFCSEPVVAFFNRLRTDFGISFASQTSNRMNLNLLAGRAGSAELEEQIYDAQNLDFIKQFAPRDIETIYLLANVPQELRPVASRLRAEFRYDLQFSHAGVLEDEAGLQLLVSDTVKEQKLFAPEQASRIKRVLRCGYFSHSTVSDLSAMGDLPPPAVDLIEALHTHLRYHFRLSDAPTIEKFMGEGGVLGALAAKLQKYSFEFKISELGTLAPLLPLDVEGVDRELAVLLRHDQKFKFTAEQSLTVRLLVERGYTDADMAALDALYTKHTGTEHGSWIPYDIPKLIFLREHSDIVEETHTALQAELSKGGGAWMNPISNGETLAKIHDSNLLQDIRRHKETPVAVTFILENIDRVGDIEPSKRKEFIEIALSIKESPSQEIKRLERELIAQLLLTEDPVGFYKKVESIFIKNNLPTFGKIFKIFETLHSPKQLASSLSEKNSSPVLVHASSRKRLMLIYRDLLQTHIRSGNRSLRRYAEVLRDGEALLSRAEKEGVETLDAREQEELTYLLAKCETLFLNSQLGKSQSESAFAAPPDLHTALARLRTGIGVREGESIQKRIAEMFLRPAGFQTLDEMLEAMKASKHAAHERGITYARDAKDGTLALSAGDLLKGVDIRFIASILQNGSVAKEFLGASSSKDSTPLDTDVSRVTAQDTSEGFRQTVRRSLAAGYGSLLIAIKDRSQFSVTRSEGAEHLETHDPSKLELFETRVVGAEHFGIRTGFPSTEVDFLVADDRLASFGTGEQELERLYFEVAQNGYYIPVVDFDGRIIFTPEMYAERRKIFDGLERFDGDAYSAVLLPRDGKTYRKVQEIVKEQSDEREALTRTLQTIRSAVSHTLSRSGVVLKSEFDTGLLGAEFVETGSIGRGTNLPGDYDFDFALKLDARDFPKASSLAAELKKSFTMETDESHGEPSGYYQLRAMNVSRIGGVALETPVSIDIGFTNRSDLAVFDTQDALMEGFDGIESTSGLEARQEVIGNIVLAKTLLKEGGAYKKQEHGGLGGVGVENWILQHGGNIEEAFRSFLKVCHTEEGLKPLNEFQDEYPIRDPGVNIKKHRHDNFILNLTETGYENMVKVIEMYLNHP